LVPEGLRGLTVLFSGFGCSVDDAQQLGDDLETIAEAGFTHAEIRPRDWDLWLNGGLNDRELQRYIGVLGRFRDRLAYTLHGPYELNLCDGDGRHRRLLRAAVEVACAIDASAVVVHPGRIEGHLFGAGGLMDELMARERQALLEITERENNWTGSLALETWFAVDDVAYSYAIWPMQLARQVETIAHERIGVCMDIGHLQLAASWFGFDFREAVRRLAPITAHVHLHENFGVLTGEARIELGHGDLHLPPAWANLALGQALEDASFARVPVLNVEVAARLSRPHLTSILVECKRLAAYGRIEDMH
jgi:sugar phosphate isomerase/epimerase